MPRREPHDRLPGQGRHDARRHDDPQDRADRRLDDRAGQSRRAADDVLQPAPGRRVGGADHDHRPAHEAPLARRGAGRAGEAPAVLRLVAAVPADDGRSACTRARSSRSRSRRGRRRWRSASARTRRGARAAARGKCEDTSAQTAQMAANQLAQYFCLYRTARLTYTRDADRGPGEAAGRSSGRARSLSSPGRRPGSASRTRRSRRCRRFLRRCPSRRRSRRRFHRCRRSSRRSRPCRRWGPGSGPGPASGPGRRTSSCRRPPGRSSCRWCRSPSCPSPWSMVEVEAVVPPARASAPAGTVRSGVDLGTLSAALLSEPQPERPRAPVTSSTARGTADMRTRIRAA